MAILLFIPIILLSSCSYNPYYIRYPFQPIPKVQAKVLRISDGDTILVVTQNNVIFTPLPGQEIQPFETNEVRFIFIDTPESGENPRLERNLLTLHKKGSHSRKNEIIELGKLADQHLNEILKIGQIVDIEFPAESIKDRYGRFLCLVYYNNINLNYLQVYDGYAKAYFLSENNSIYINYYRNLFQNTENTAKIRKSGIWRTDLWY
jgi:endonuclease YncB( thermonuclease family)